MKKLMILAAMLAMGLLVAAPAIAQVEQEFDEQDAESGAVDQSFTVTGGGSNGNSCTPLQGSAQTGNSQNEIGVTQYESEADEFEFEEIESNVTFNSNSSTECTQEVNQAASAAAAPKATPPPPPPPPAPKSAPAPAPAPAPKAVAETPKAEAKAEAPKAVAETPKAEAKAEAPKAEEKKAEEKKELPKTGGNGTASLFALGAGALLVAGGLLARRIV